MITMNNNYEYIKNLIEALSGLFIIQSISELDEFLDDIITEFMADNPVEGFTRYRTDKTMFKIFVVTEHYAKNKDENVFPYGFMLNE